MRKPIVIVVSVVVGLIFLGMFLSLLGGSMLFNCGNEESSSSIINVSRILFILIIMNI